MCLCVGHGVCLVRDEWVKPDVECGAVLGVIMRDRSCVCVGV